MEQKLRNQLRNQMITEPTQEQIDAIIKKYSNKKRGLDFFYEGETNTLIMLQLYLQKGITINQFAYGLHGVPDYKILPEYKTPEFPSKNTVKAWINQTAIVKTILQNFVNSNPDYFRKVSKTKYAVKDEFILSLLIHNKDKGFNATDISSILPYIVDHAIFNKIAETFFLPYKKGETLEKVKNKYFHKCIPYKYSKREGIK
jgi:hypothetical protein